MERRNFLKGACSLVLAPATLAFLEACSAESATPKKAVNFSIDLSNSTYAALGTVGGVVLQQGVYIVRTSTGYLALSNVCTHEGCAVTYSSGSGRFVCPCHNGIFDQSGAVVSGPPPSALARYTVNVSGNTLSVS
ncbi:MAG: Rieske (2Fe-2S) protein [Cyclobacteriaceae bacterium]|nr:Rieske (2Fe-2S) protein [Cyclobacteriaceae bacterium]